MLVLWFEFGSMYNVVHASWLTAIGPRNLCHEHWGTVDWSAKCKNNLPLFLWCGSIARKASFATNCWIAVGPPQCHTWQCHCCYRCHCPWLSNAACWRPCSDSTITPLTRWSTARINGSHNEHWLHATYIRGEREKEKATDTPRQFSWHLNIHSSVYPQTNCLRHVVCRRIMNKCHLQTKRPISKRA